MSEGIYYDSASVYISSRTTLRAKITALDSIIDKLEEMALVAAGTVNIEEYSLDDGQTRIRTKYTSSLQITESILAFERIRQMYINRLNGRMSRLSDGRNFTGNIN